MFLILGFDMYASTTTLFETLFVTAGVLWLRLVLLFRLATLLPSSYLQRQFSFTPRRFWVLLRPRNWLKYPLFLFFSLCYTCIYSFLFLVFLSFCLVCFSLSFLSLCSYLHRFFFSNFPLLQLQIGGLCQPRYPVTSGHIPMHRHVPA